MNTETHTETIPAPATISAAARYRGKLVRIPELVADPEVPAGCRATVHLWLRQGRIRGRLVAGARMIEGDSVADLLEGNS